MIQFIGCQVELKVRDQVMGGILVRMTEDMLILKGDDGKPIYVPKRAVLMLRPGKKVKRPLLYVLAITDDGEDTGLRFLKVGQPAQNDFELFLRESGRTTGRVVVMGEMCELSEEELLKSFDGVITGGEEE